MKKLFVIIFVLVFFNSFSQHSFSQQYEEKLLYIDKLEIGKIENETQKIVVNEKDFIETMNYHFSDKKKYFNSMTIQKEYYEGANYYYISMKSNMNKDLVIALKKIDDKLFIDNKYGIRIFICEGDNNCFARFFGIDKETNSMLFSCRETILCVDEETVNSNPCEATKSLITY